MTGLRRWGAGLVFLLPSILLVGIFVYGFIGRNIFTSFEQVVTKSGKVLRVTAPHHATVAAVS